MTTDLHFYDIYVPLRTPGIQRQFLRILRSEAQNACAAYIRYYPAKHSTNTEARYEY